MQKLDIFKNRSQHKPFIRKEAARLGRTYFEITEHYIVEPCHCDSPRCEGWKLVKKAEPIPENEKVELNRD